MFTLKVLEENENPLETIIEMSGVTTKFTTQQILDHMAYTEKTLKETVSQMDAEDIQNTMAEEILPVLKEIPEDKWQLVMVHASRKVQRPESIGLKESCEKTLVTYGERLNQIKNDLGISTEKVESVVATEKTDGEENS